MQYIFSRMCNNIPPAGVDIMQLPRTSTEYQYVLVFQDFLTKWPSVFPLRDQTATRLGHFLVNEVIPTFGMPEALLSNRGANLLSHRMTEVCTALGIQRLLTTTYHPQCNGMVERFNRTLKAMLRKHATQYGQQWDKYLSVVLWAYQNTPHEAKSEKPSFLLFGFDCRSPPDASFLPPSGPITGEAGEYRRTLMESLLSAREIAALEIRAVQEKYRRQYDKSTEEFRCVVRDWVFVRFPHEESGKRRKLSRPWFGPYRIISRRDPDLDVQKVYAPQDGVVKVHQSRVKPSPPSFPAGHYWYGGNRRGAGALPSWVSEFLEEDESD